MISRQNHFFFISGVVVYLILILFAYIFWKERTIFLDIAFHLFFIIKDGDFAIQNQRFGAVITQAFPLVSSRLNFDLETVMKSYSIGFAIYYFTVYLINFKVFKNAAVSICMLLFSTLMISKTFYWIQSELPQGIAFSILFFGLVTKAKDLNGFHWLELVAGALMVIVIAFFHPLMVILFTYLCAFYIIKKDIANKGIIIASYLWFVLVLILKKVLIVTPAYDSQATSSIGNFVKLFPDYFTLQSNVNFVNYIISDYYLLILAFIAIIIFYIDQRKFKELILVGVSFFGYLLLVNVAYPQGAEQFYIENLYLPLSIIVIFPLVYDVLLNERLQKWARIGLLFILMISLGRIYFAHEPFEERLIWYKNFLSKVEQNDQDKLLIDDKLVPKEKLLMTWATSYEFWLLSTLEGSETRSIIIDDNINVLDWALYDSNGFLTKWGMFNYQDLPDKYFNLNDTTTTYRKITTETELKDVLD